MQTDPKEVLGKRIRKLRLSKGLSLREFSSSSGIDKGYLSRVENGLIDPRGSSLRKLATALGVSVSRLMA